MNIKVLAISGVARAGAVTRARAGAAYFPVPTIRDVPRLQAPLEGRWRIDAATGILSAVWMDPSANTSARAAVKPELSTSGDVSSIPVRPSSGLGATRLAASDKK
jgi:hypothetical protein